MRAQTTAEQTPSTSTDDDPQRPYRDYALVYLIEWLEAQYSRGEPFNENVVWELAARAAEAEQGLGR
jgi:hypothetical protein